MPLKNTLNYFGEDNFDIMKFDSLVDSLIDVKNIDVYGYTIKVVVSEAVPKGTIIMSAGNNVVRVLLDEEK